MRALKLALALCLVAASASAQIAVTPTSVSFTYTKGAALPAAKSITVTVPGGTRWTTFYMTEWFDTPTACWPSRGTCASGTSIPLTPNSAMSALAVGSYTGSLRISAAGQSDANLPVTLVVTSSTPPPPPPPPPPPAIGCTGGTPTTTCAVSWVDGNGHLDVGQAGACTVRFYPNGPTIASPTRSATAQVAFTVAPLTATPATRTVVATCGTSLPSYAQATFAVTAAPPPPPPPPPAVTVVGCYRTTTDLKVMSDGTQTSSTSTQKVVCP